MTFRMTTVRPEDISSTLGGNSGRGDEEKDDGKANIHVGTEDNGCFPIEDDEEAVKVKMLPSPSPPSRQEMLEHNLTHWPFSELVQALRGW